MCGRNVKRYQHYFTRWEGHSKSADLMTKEQEKKLQEKVEELETFNSTLNDHTWLFQALFIRSKHSIEARNLKYLQTQRW